MERERRRQEKRECNPPRDENLHRGREREWCVMTKNSEERERERERKREIMRERESDRRRQRSKER